jgi:hypothetical protein
MTVKKRTYFKALLLVIVFSLNTVISFACSFSSLFHGVHHHNSSVAAPDKHNGSVAHTHNHEAQPHKKTDSKEEQKGDCCSTSIVEVEKTDKSVSRTIEAPDTLFLAAFIATYSSLLDYFTVERTVKPHWDRWRPPATIQDIRIVIQSFQI